MLHMQKLNIKSASLAIISALFLSILMSLAKQLHTDIPTKLVVFIRSCFGLILFLPVIIANRHAIQKTTKLPLHILRIILTVTAMLCTYYAYRNLPIVFTTSIGMSSPLFTTTLSFMILKEHIAGTKWLAVIVGYTGVIIILRPTSFEFDLGTLSAITANILAATSIIVVKILSRYDSAITIMFYTTIGIVIISGLYSFNVWQKIHLQDLALLFAMGFLGATSQFCLINAVKYSSPSFVAPFEYTRIFFATLIGITIFNETLSICTVAGSALILLSSYMILCVDIKKEKNIAIS